MCKLKIKSSLLSLFVIANSDNVHFKTDNYKLKIGTGNNRFKAKIILQRTYTSRGHVYGFLVAEFLPIAALLKQLRSLLSTQA